jgi:hypothetical protein
MYKSTQNNINSSYDIVNLIFTTINNNKWTPDFAKKTTKLILDCSDISYIILKILAKKNYKSNVRNIFFKPIYKLEFYEPIFKMLNYIIVSNPNKKNIYNNISMSYLERLSSLKNGYIYLNNIKDMIKETIVFNDVNKLLLITSEKGSYMTFMFWNKMKYQFNLCQEQLNNYNIKIISNSIINSDMRIFEWFLKFYKKNSSDTIESNKIDSAIVFVLIATLLKSNMKNKHKLIRLKLLNKYYDLKPHVGRLISYSNLDITMVLMKNYYINNDKVIIYPWIYEIINKNYFSVNIKEHNDKLNIVYETLKTNLEKTYMIIFKTLLTYCSKIGNHNIYNTPFIKLSSDSKGFILKNVELLFNKFITLNNIITLECSCKSHCMNGLFLYLYKHNIFHNIPFKMFNCSLLLTKFYYSNDYYKYSLAVNRTLSLLRITLKRKIKNKMIKKQTVMLPVLYELLNYKPNNIKVLKNGSINWRYNEQKFNQKQYIKPPRFTDLQYIFIYKMPSNVFPYFPSDYIVSGVYYPKLQLYIIDDVDIPNTLFEERQKFILSFNQYNNINNNITLFLEKYNNIVKWLPNL